jgi:hypothetical protein
MNSKWENFMFQWLSTILVLLIAMSIFVNVYRALFY